MYTIFQIAKWFFERNQGIMQAKKLQKLCWYAYSWYIALNYNPEEESYYDKLFDEEAEAWVHGPVFRRLYSDFRYNNYFETNKADIDSINGDTVAFLERIWNVYGSYNGEELEEISHNEAPWKNARGNLGRLEPSSNVINDADIISEYLNR